MQSAAKLSQPRCRARFVPEIESLETRLTPSGGLLVVGADAGTGPAVKVFDVQTHTQTYKFLAYPSDFRGGVRVAVGNVLGDDDAEIITAPGAGAPPRVNVLDAKTGALLRSFLAFDPEFGRGVELAVGDVNGDSTADIIVSAGRRVRIVDGNKLDQVQNTGRIRGGALLGNFEAFRNAGAPVRVAAGDIDGDNAADIIVAAGPGSSPRVKVFSGGVPVGKLLHRFFAFGPARRGGVSVAAGDVDGDGRDDIIAGSGAGARARVKVYSGGEPAQVLSRFFVFGARYQGGARVAVTNVDGDQRADVVVAQTAAFGPQVKVVRGATGARLQSYVPFSDAVNGVFVAGSWLAG